MPEACVCLGTRPQHYLFKAERYPSSLRDWLHSYLLTVFGIAASFISP